MHLDCKEIAQAKLRWQVFDWSKTSTEIEPMEILMWTRPVLEKDFIT
jgi:hypothetical protein